VVDRPAARHVLVVGERSLATNEQIATRRITRILVTAEQAGNFAISAWRTSSALYGVSRISSNPSPRNRKMPPLMARS
jgi:hypothetical protein